MRRVCPVSEALLNVHPLRGTSFNLWLGWVAQGWPMRGAQEMSSLTILPRRKNGRPIYGQNHSEEISFLPWATPLALNSPTLYWVSKDRGPSCH